MWIVKYSLLLVSLSSIYKSIDAASLFCFDGSLTTYVTFSLLNPEPLLNSSCYNSSRDTVFYTYGFKGKVTDESVETIVTAYLNLNEDNIVLVDWETEASSGSWGDLAYLRAVPNAIAVGKKFGQSLLRLIKVGLKLVSIRLVGISLGAHLMGYAAREVQSTGKKIPMIIGLDPAGPFFEGLISLRGLDATCGAFVLAIHSNPGVLGITRNAGTVDVWTNCEERAQPGCIDQTLEHTVPNSQICSHNRSWIYYGEALGRPNTFIARSATSCKSWKKKGENKQTISIGRNVDTRLRGDFYLQTNSVPFYGRGEKGSYFNNLI